EIVGLPASRRSPRSPSISPLAAARSCRATCSRPSRRGKRSPGKRDPVRSGPPLRRNVAREVVENGLPAGALLLDGMRRLTIEGYAHPDAIRPRRKLHLRRAVAERIGDELVLDDLRIGSGEIEAHAAVLRLHARGKGAAHA